MKQWERIALLLGLGFVGLLSLQPIFPDPYYHKEKVNFWVWAYREIDEMLHGEKNHEDKSQNGVSVNNRNTCD